MLLCLMAVSLIGRIIRVSTPTYKQFKKICHIASKTYNSKSD